MPAKTIIEITSSKNNKGTLVIIQPTSFCNIDCRYCYLPKRSSKLKISKEILSAIFNGIFTSEIIRDPITILWHAGEPLTIGYEFYRDAFDLALNINQSYQREFTHSIQTNATLLTENWVKLFSDYKVSVGVSIDGPSFLHDANRVTRSGKGTHAKVMKGISLLQQGNIEFGIIAVLTEKSLDFPDEMWNFFLSNKLTSISFNIDEIEGINTNSSYSQNRSTEKYTSFMYRFFQNATKSRTSVSIREFDLIYRQIFLEMYDADTVTNDPNIPFAIINFDHQGNFSTFSPELVGISAPKYKNFIMGNIISDKLDSIRDNNVFQLLNAEIQEGVQDCKRECEYWRFCGGGDPANKYAETGRFDVTETISCIIHRKTLTNTVLNFLEELSTAAKP